ncbi:MFS transporter [Actinomyces culturomici]|uniref:MFS transporter n=1 Tax=Actinomyces culturomici TaxID=1926276 RepID=UPI000E2084AD|nr:MFS transporter [Actinomyces culturomici]
MSEHPAPPSSIDEPPNGPRTPDGPAAPDPATPDPGAPDPDWKRRVGLFLGAQAISLFGSSIVQFAIMWHLTLVLKAGWVIMLYSLVAFVPQALVSLFGGALADRMNRRTVIVVSDTAIALVTLGLALAMTFGDASLWLILVAVAARSIGQGFQQPAVAALLPQLAPADALMRVNGINQTINSAMALLSPVVAGAVYAWGGLVPTFGIDVVTALIGVGIVLTIPVATVRSGDATGTSLTRDLVDGLRYVLGHRTIAWLMVLYTVIFTLVVAPSFLIPLFIARTFSDAVWPLSISEAAFSAGMLVGGALIATVAVKGNQSRMLLWSCLSFGLVSAAFGLTPLLGRTGGLWATFALSFGVAVAIPFFSAPVMTLLQTSVEPEFMGRVFSVTNIVAVLGMPAGMVVLGPLADRVPFEAIFIVTGLAAFAFTVASFLAEPGREVLAMRAVSPYESASSEPEPMP